MKYSAVNTTNERDSRLPVNSIYAKSIRRKDLFTWGFNPRLLKMYFNPWSAEKLAVYFVSIFGRFQIISVHSAVLQALHGNVFKQIIIEKNLKISKSLEKVFRRNVKKIPQGNDSGDSITKHLRI